MNDLIEIRNLSSKHIISPTNTLTVDDPNELLIINGSLVGLLYTVPPKLDRLPAEKIITKFATIWKRSSP